ncbi:TonB-dependent receptor [Sinomicrobium weinanense]|uniref:TonB-dependent receptor n=1 Tax=Sinomicrobium weinanense TaxID=2842200 RepID=A0A926JTQ7_9FLAO|nr:TonB-dependent receptor [Sinomicrobium weinanense]MBC9797206.1 TonB-dependent receptor [Sinomicrobium weinanense]MBU3122730.1 TonB-dependent receptor [Sinomicrobium weinanense]
MWQNCIGTLLGVFLCSVSYTQELYDIRGKVTDKTSGTPLSGAYITVGKHTGITDINGIFQVRDIPEGHYKVKATFLGYADTVLAIAIPADTTLEITMYEGATALNEVVVNGIKHRNYNEVASLPSYTVSEDFMNENRENSLMQTLKKLPGVSTINIGSGQSKPVIRGLGFNRVAVIQNGVKHEAQQWGSDHALEIDQYGIETIEIVKGPASLLYGSDAIAGVVNIQPPGIPEKNSLSGEVNLLAESNNDLYGISAGIRARKDKWFYRGRLTFRDYADYKVPTDQINYENYIFDLHKSRLRNTAGNEINGSFSLGYVSDRIRSETFFSNVYARNGFFANAHGLEVRTSEIDYDRSARDIDYPYHEVNHFKITNNTVVFSGDHTFRFELGFQNNHREEHSEPVPHGYMPKPDNGKERVFKKNTYTLNARDTFKAGDKHTLTAGVNLELQDNTIGGWGFLIPGYQRFTAGIFAYDQFEIRNDLHLQAGLRYDYGVMDTEPYYDWFPSPLSNSDGTTSYVHLQRAQDKTRNFGNVSASLGLNYTKGNTTYKINLGKSFRMPLANELASDGVNYHMYRFEKGDPDLDPEQSYQIDLALEHSSGAFDFGISPFVNFFHNYIYLNPTPDYYESLQIYEYTQSKVFRIGGEIRAGITLFGKLRLDASGEYVYSEQTSGVKKGYTLPFSPPLSGLFSAEYKLKDFLFFKSPLVFTSYRITAEQNEIVPPERRTAGFRVMDFSFLTEIDLFRTPVEMRLKVNNLFDSKYFDHTSFYRLIEVPEAGRNFSVSLAVPF